VVLRPVVTSVRAQPVRDSHLVEIDITERRAGCRFDLSGRSGRRGSVLVPGKSEPARFPREFGHLSGRFVNDLRPECHPRLVLSHLSLCTRLKALPCAALLSLASDEEFREAICTLCNLLQTKLSYLPRSALTNSKGISA
jgi:hypothetical protein